MVLGNLGPSKLPGNRAITGIVLVNGWLVVWIPFDARRTRADTLAKAPLESRRHQKTSGIDPAREYPDHCGLDIDIRPELQKIAETDSDPSVRELALEQLADHRLSL